MMFGMRVRGGLLAALIMIAVPSNDFGGQEPGSPEQIRAAFESNVSFNFEGSASEWGLEAATRALSHTDVESDFVNEVYSKMASSLTLL